MVAYQLSLSPSPDVEAQPEAAARAVDITLLFTAFLDMGAERAGAHERHKVRKEGFQSAPKALAALRRSSLTCALGLEENLRPIV